MQHRLIDIVTAGTHAVVAWLDAGGNIDERDADNRTLLMHAVIDNRLDIIQLLLARKANVDALDAARFSALHFAAQDYHLEAAKLLLDAGATVDIKDVFGNTPLWRAVFNSRGRIGLTQVLVAYGADKSQENASGVSAAKLAQNIANYDLSRIFGDDL